ncbi:hypothetical protein EJD97_013331 [Solanum chilense]|uniref:Uncharacterized protein n=1 Tax=Solanum chilense TaxID=4083 RepID=A0A6N2BJP3_SOLCI|nr:hypothetical protein EJD97_013331 [Solanum chilense]
MSVVYHPNKANVAADVLSLMTMGSVSHVEEAKKDLEKDVHRFARLGLDWKIVQKVVLWYQGRLCVPKVDNLSNWIFEEAHGSHYSIHTGSTKMYHDLREVYWWERLKKDIAEFVAKYPNCQQVKSKHINPGGLLQVAQAERTIKLFRICFCVIDFKGSWDKHLPFVEFVYNNSFHSFIFMDPYEDLYGRKCKSPIGWFEVGPYEILQRVCEVAYKLKLPSELASIHPVFHVSMHKKCIGEPESMLPIKGPCVKGNLSYEEFPVQILYTQVGRLRNKKVASVKMFWKNHLVEGATWESKADMKSCYPHLFNN